MSAPDRDPEDHGKFDHGLLILLAVRPFTPARARLAMAWSLLRCLAGVLLQSEFSAQVDIGVRVTECTEIPA